MPNVALMSILESFWITGVYKFEENLRILGAEITLFVKDKNIQDA